MSKEYVMQLEATIANYRRDNQILKDELFKYRALDEELGCPLEILVEALKNGVWVEVDPLDRDCDHPETMYLEEFVYLTGRLNGTLYLDVRNYVDELELKDYKKTWWLKEDRSE